MRTSVDLPAPLDPMMPEHLAFQDGQAHVVDGCGWRKPRLGKTPTWMFFSSIMERPSFATIT